MTGQADRVLLSATGLTKRFDALVVLDDVDFVVHEHDAVGIVGPNGAGKTTLLSVLSGAQRPSGGRIRLRDADVTHLSAAERCRLGIVRTHQVPRSFGGMSVFENVFVAASHGGGFGRHDAEARAFDALTLCGMRRVADRRAETLGLLDRKRLELARALATNPAVLLLDEIGGGLTDGEAAELVVIVKELRQRGIAIVWIEHIVHVLLRVIDRLVCMDAGKVIAAGEPAAVLADPAVIGAYFGEDVPCPVSS
jgi:branched-chain amino acid transport system ATP-binding protein